MWVFPCTNRKKTLYGCLYDLTSIYGNFPLGTSNLTICLQFPWINVRFLSIHGNSPFWAPSQAGNMWDSLLHMGIIPLRAPPHPFSPLLQLAWQWNQFLLPASSCAGPPQPPSPPLTVCSTLNLTASYHGGRDSYVLVSLSEDCKIKSRLGHNVQLLVKHMLLTMYSMWY